MKFEDLHKEIINFEWKKYKIPFEKQKDKVQYDKFKIKGVPIHHYKKGVIPAPMYSPDFDCILMYRQDLFNEAEYYAVIFHEAAHASGAKHRLARHAIATRPHITVRDLAEEEIVAETTALLLCHHFGLKINYDVHFNYIRNYKTEFFKASGFPGLSKASFKKCFEQAEQAYHYILDNMLEVSNV